VLLVLLLGAGYWWTLGQPSASSIELEENPTATATELPTGNANDNRSLEEDLAALDAQIAALGTDVQNIDLGLEEAEAAE